MFPGLRVPEWEAGRDVPAVVGPGQAHEHPQVDSSRKLPCRTGTGGERCPGSGT